MADHQVASAAGSAPGPAAHSNAAKPVSTPIYAAARPPSSFSRHHTDRAVPAVDMAHN